MKQNYLKTILCMLMLCVGMSAWADEEETYNFASFTSGTTVELKATNFTITLKKNLGSTNPTFNGKSGEARIYAKGSMEISSTKKITKVVYAYTVNANSSGVTPTISSVKGATKDGTWNAETKTWTGSDSKVTLTTTGSAGNIGFTSVTVTYENTISSNDITFSPIAGTYTTAQNVSLTAALEGSTIYYTMDGTTPTTSSSKYTSPIAVTTSGTISALVVKSGYSDVVKTSEYVIKPAQPTFKIGSNTLSTNAYNFKKAIDVDITAAEGCSIYYTTDGTNPTTSSTKYTSAINITETTTLKAIAVDAYGNTSSYKQLTLTLVEGTSFDFTTKQYGYGLSSSSSTDGDVSDGDTFTENLVSITWKQNPDKANTRFWSKSGTPEIRIYDGSSFTVSVPAGYLITRIDFTGTVNLKVGDEAVSGKVWTGSTENVTFVNTTNNSAFQEIIVKVEATATSATLSVGEAGYATYYNSLQAYTMPEGCEGYVAYMDGGFQFKMAYNAGEVVPANTGLVIKADKGNYTLKFTTGGTAPAKNDLKGSDVAADTEGGDDYHYYMLSLNAANELSSVGFYFADENGKAFQNGAHKAYLAYTAAQVGSVKEFRFNDYETAIQNVDVDENADQTIYDLSGRKVSNAQKGIYIKNGHKFMK